MGFFGLFKKKDNRANHDFNKDDRELSLQLRQQQIEFKKQKQELDLELQRLKAEREKILLESQIDEMKEKLGYFDNEEQEPENMTDSLIQAAILKFIGNTPQSVQPLNVAVSESHSKTINKQHLTDEQINSYIEALPRHYFKIARKMSDEQLKVLISNQMPLLDEDSINRSVLLVKGK